MIEDIHLFLEGQPEHVNRILSGRATSNANLPEEELHEWELVQGLCGQLLDPMHVAGLGRSPGISAGVLRLWRNHDLADRAVSSRRTPRVCGEKYGLGSLACDA